MVKRGQRNLLVIAVVLIALILVAVFLIPPITSLVTGKSVSYSDFVYNFELPWFDKANDYELGSLRVYIKDNRDKDQVLIGDLILYDRNYDFLTRKGARDIDGVLFENLDIRYKGGDEFYLRIKVPGYSLWAGAVTIFPGEDRNLEIFLDVDSRFESCEETDRGFETLNPGTVKTKNEKNRLLKNELTDYCEGDTLIEYYCDWNGFQKAEIGCENGCFEDERGGRCIQEDYCEGTTCLNLAESSCQSDSNLLYNDPNLFKNGGLRLREDKTYNDYWLANDEIDKEEKLRNSQSSYIEPELREIPEKDRDFLPNYDQIPKLDLENYCLDDDTLAIQACSSESGFIDDVSVRVTTETYDCPEGYGCSGGRCIQREREIFPGIGDANLDGVTDDIDLKIIEGVVNSDDLYYTLLIDFDMDGYIDSYDLENFRKYFADPSFAQEKREIRDLDLTSGSTVYQGEYFKGRLKETEDDKTSENWKIEYVQKGNSRNRCKPPVMNVKFKKKDLFYGFSSYPPALSTLGYRKVKFIPDCDILSRHEVNNQLREYIIYTAFRNFGIPTIDVVGFADVKIDSDESYDSGNNAGNPGFVNGEPLQYMLLQRDDEDKDQIPFMTQYGFSELLQNSKDDQYSSFYRSLHNNRFTSIHISWHNGENIDEIYNLDTKVAIKYHLLSNLFNLHDRSTLWNEHYGYDGRIGLWRQVPFDLDSSFYCSRWPGSDPLIELQNIVNNLPAEEGKKYKLEIYNAARELFDNPDNLNYLLSLVDEYPYRENSDKMKMSLRANFYYNALTFSSDEFAEWVGQPHTTFQNREAYIRETRKILKLGKERTMCSERNKLFDLLKEMIQEKEDVDDQNQNFAGGGGNFAGGGFGGGGNAGGGAGKIIEEPADVPNKEAFLDELPGDDEADVDEKNISLNR